MERLVACVLPLVFLTDLWISEFLYKKRKINIDGVPPISKKLFYTAKYLVILVWAGMPIHAFGLGYSIVPNNAVLRIFAICLWIIGFIGLFIGKSTLGLSFRIGTPTESVKFSSGGPYKISRNPMYLSLNLTLIASTLYARCPVILLLSAFIIIVHHQIILAEEDWLRQTFGQVYEGYYQRVRRYI